MRSNGSSLHWGICHATSFGARTPIHNIIRWLHRRHWYGMGISTSLSIQPCRWMRWKTGCNAIAALTGMVLVSFLQRILIRTAVLTRKNTRMRSCICLQNPFRAWHSSVDYVHLINYTGYSLKSYFRPPAHPRPGG